MNKKRMQVGFVITPGEIAGRIEALDAAIMRLDADVTASKAPKLDLRWREAFHAFVRRWQVERDTYAEWTARLFATRVMPRLEGFETSYRQWAKQFETRTGQAPTYTPPRPSEGIVDAVLPRWFWPVAVGVGVFLYYRK